MKFGIYVLTVPFSSLGLVLIVVSLLSSPPASLCIFIVAKFTRNLVFLFSGLKQGIFFKGRYPIFLILFKLFFIAGFYSMIKFSLLKLYFEIILDLRVVKAELLHTLHPPSSNFNILYNFSAIFKTKRKFRWYNTN